MRRLTVEETKRLNRGMARVLVIGIALNLLSTAIALVLWRVTGLRLREPALGGSVLALTTLVYLLWLRSIRKAQRQLGEST